MLSLALSISDLMKRAAFALSSEERALGAGLENNVHPLYRRINFRASALTAEKTRVEEDEQFVKMQVYERMIPAFRLASLLLGFILPFYTKVFCADIIFVGQQYALNPTYECTDTDAQRVRGLLVEATDRTRFYCSTPFVDLASPDDLIALAMPEVRANGGLFPTPGPRPAR